jgi:putative RNA 2'-phosphotransferase
MSRESKFLSLVLRHKPDEIDIKLDSAGWVMIDQLLRSLKRAGRAISKDDLETIVRESEKRRFTISSDGRRIRAAQGHSVNVDLGLLPSEPPKFLYHGTASQNLDSIFAVGLNPGRRRQVHLSLDSVTAEQVGRRHGKPVVLRVETGRMYLIGFEFVMADNEVWLTDRVPPEYLAFGVVE